MSDNRLLLKFAKPYPGHIFLTIVLGFSGALFNGVSTTLIAPIILNLSGQDFQLDGFPPIIKGLLAPFNNMSEQLRPLAMVGAILLAILLKNVTGYLSTLSSSSLKRALARDLREAGLRLLLRVDLDYYSRMQVGDLIHRLGTEVNRTAASIGLMIRMLMTSITILVFVGILIAISWQLTIASTVLLSIVALFNQSIIARAKQFGKALSESSREYSVSVLEVLSGIRLVKATGNEDKEYKHVQALIREREKLEFQSQMNAEIITPLNELTGTCIIIFILLFSRAIFSSQIEAMSTILLTYLLVLFRLLPFVSQLNNARSTFANASASVAMVNDFLNVHNKPFMENGSLEFTHLKKEICLNDLQFSYPGHPDLVLKGISLTIPRGTTLALVGSSGAGKSTLADLLPRFYDPTSGSITIDDIDLRDFDVRSLRRSMGIVSQDTFLFNDTIRNNIAYARPDATEDEIIDAAKLANAYEFIVRLPDGLNTVIGDRGVMLSGGQRQRLAIARALLQDPEILILDEATSALDTVSERLVQQAIEHLSLNRTTVVIAHRLSTVQKANQIAVLDKGLVVEVGTHSELLQKDGQYARLYSMQFSESTKKVIQTTRNETLMKLSYEIRTRLNSTLGSLRLLADGMTETPEEQTELTEEAYVSAASLLKTLEMVEGAARNGSLDEDSMENTSKLHVENANQTV
ncbi:ATP-binding cassette domain-containing protein [Oscillatoria sp. FACHB-1407]|uniref:ABC transporter ATP-binding protein n=1 Tax=Oscillatoria sp. FACHB-1407 TaxID=2692847 RepID=UPI00168233F7|nr:ABC transporter ATP-binding protein [Oscillatoria sp. FACHB-1407]MBD2461699.1 ATP-binding cassette domain-containing protein [Oscillatoria sp. FACHB-1407]